MAGGKIMILSKFYYKEYISPHNEWVLNEFLLNKNVNLLIGKNATGKTRTIYRISALVGMLIGRPYASLESLEIINSADFTATFTDTDKTYTYFLKTRDRVIDSEKLDIDGDTKLERSNDGSGKIFYEREGKEIDFHISDNKLAITSRRDTFQHPYLENLFQWADRFRCYYFGSSEKMGQQTILTTDNINNSLMKNIFFEPSRVNELFLQGKQELGDTFNDCIIEYMQEIGYDISELTVKHNPYSAIMTEDKSPLYMLCIKEKDHDVSIYQTGMSQGMFRALSLIIQITYNTLKHLSTTILIDDIGEGLDFERSTKLINLLIKLAEENDTIQLIMSTNDRYVMNNVPLEYWQVIQRKGGECTVYNYHNSKEKFDEFAYTGLNNFDFLATDFINQK